MDARGDITVLLARWGEGDRAALDALMPVVYEELRRLAHSHMRQEFGERTLSTTALVNEAYLNLAADAPALDNRTHFFGVASRVMRRVLIWYARRRSADKRGGGKRPEPLSQEALAVETQINEMIAVDDALTRLEHLDPRLCRVVECRYFTGLTIEETADVLQISPATVKRDWTTARAWLRSELSDD